MNFLCSVLWRIFLIVKYSPKAPPSIAAVMSEFSDILRLLCTAFFLSTAAIREASRLIKTIYETIAAIRIGSCINQNFLSGLRS